MGTLNVILKKTKEAIEQAKESIVGKPMPEKPVMKVAMFGARGVGKTSVLTSMYNNMNKAIEDTAFHIIADSGTDFLLAGKTDDLKRMFFYGNDVNDAVLAGIAGDSVESTFVFDFGMKTENISIGLEIKDFPGEYIRREKEIVKQYLRESNAILIAIDTPHMMECDGIFNEGKNRTSEITGFFKEVLNQESDSKLIMLVPLKCEKYYHEGKISQVTQMVEQTYAELIDFLSMKEKVKDSSNVSEEGRRYKFATVITPILTVGEIVFDGFQMEDGKPAEVLFEGNRVPKQVNYKYQKPGAQYSPKYCEQPLYYLLSFVAKQYNEMKKESTESGLFGKLKKMFAMEPEKSSLILGLHKFRQKKVKDVDGFKVLTGSGKV